jgi:hypothetical protein
VEVFHSVVARGLGAPSCVLVSIYEVIEGVQEFGCVEGRGSVELVETWIERS